MKAAAVVERKAYLEFAGSQPSCVRLCSHVGCVKSVHVRGVCNFHGPRCSHVGCIRSVIARGVCRGHGPRCSHMGAAKMSTLEISAKGMTAESMTYTIT